MRQRVFAWIALVLALVHPLMVISYALVIVLLMRSQSNPGSIVVESLYNVTTYFVWPLPIIALFLGSLTLGPRERRNTIARVAIILSALSILAIAGAVIALAFLPGQSASSATSQLWR